MSFHSKYVCQQCGFESTGWLGKCPECGTWNSLVETVISTSKSKKGKNKDGSRSTTHSSPVNLSDIKKTATKRILTRISELDSVLGGGLVPGQAVLIAGEPGIGKSTLLTQLANNLSSTGKGPSALYVCGEESVNQVKVRADRLNIKKKQHKPFGRNGC